MAAFSTPLKIFSVVEISRLRSYPSSSLKSKLMSTGGLDPGDSVSDSKLGETPLFSPFFRHRAGI